MGNDSQKISETNNLNIFVCGNIMDLFIDQTKANHIIYQKHKKYTHPETSWYFTEVLENEVDSMLEQAIENRKEDEKNMVVLLSVDTIFCQQVRNIINNINKLHSIYHPFLIITTKREETKEELVNMVKMDFDNFDQRNVFVIKLIDTDIRAIYMRLFKISSYYNQLGDTFNFPLSVDFCNMIDEKGNNEDETPIANIVINSPNAKEAITLCENKYKVGQKETITKKAITLFESNYTHRINFLVIGRPGSGKSAFINKILGEKRALEKAGKSVTSKILKYNHSKYPISIYDTPGFETQADMEEKFDLIKKMNKKLNEKQSDIIHMIIYLINSQDERTLLKTEITFFKKIIDWSKEELDKDVEITNKRELSLIFVHTHGTTKKKSEKKKVILNETLKDIYYQDYKNKIFPVELFEEEDLSSFGMDILFDYLKNYFEKDRITIEETLKRLDNKQEKEIYELVKTSRLLSKIRSKEDIKLFCHYSASAIISSTCVTATAIGASPIPFADWFLITSIQVAMIVGIGALYGIQFSKNEALVIIKSLIVAGLVSGICRGIASGIKFIPGIGTITGIVIDSVVSAAGTAGIGWATIEICDKELDKFGLKDFYLKAINEYNQAIDSFSLIKEQFIQEYSHL